MLVLSRKPNQSLKIGNDIEVKVLRVAGDNVRLGVEAPPDVKILRSELEGKPPRLKPQEEEIPEPA